MTINFGEEDYTEFENTGSVSVTVAKLEDNVETIVINVVPLTFAQFSMLNITLPEELQPLVASTNPAECKPHSILCHLESDILHIHIGVSTNHSLSNEAYFILIDLYSYSGSK